MKTQNGWSGSLNPGMGAEPINSADTSGKSLVVIRVRRIAESQPTVWEGVTPAGRKVHIAYLYGVVTVELAQPVPDRPRFVTWVCVAKFKPAIMEAELNEKSTLGQPVLHVMAERSMMTELRRSNEADMRDFANEVDGKEETAILLNRHRLIIRNGQLLRWMEMRNINLATLQRKGIAGGKIPVEIHFA
ncbi:MAG: hypothetical protein ACK5NG_10075 [Chthoniobacterales bacterium]